MANALQFNGSPDKIAFGNILNSQTIFSVCIWFQIGATPSGNADIIFGYGNRRWFLIHEANGTNFRFTVRISAVEQGTGNTTFNPSLNTWYFAVGTYDPDGGSDNLTLRVYNSSGVLQEARTATKTGAVETTASALEAGHDPNRGFFWQGTVQLLKVYSRVLTTTEQNNLALFIDPNSVSLEGVWDINEGSGTNVNDISGADNDGTITGSTWITTGIGTTTSTSTSSSTSTTSTSTSSSSTSTSTSTTTTFPFPFFVRRV